MAGVSESMGARRDLIAIGASAGGVETLRALVAELPGDLRAAPPDAPSLLPTIFESQEGETTIARRYGEQADDADEQVRLLCSLLVESSLTGESSDPGG